MPLVDKSNTYTGVGVGASGVGSLVSILAFALPYWIYYDEDLTLTDGTGSHQVQWTYYYGFWKFCNKVSSDVSNSDRCGSVESHSDVEQTTACLLLLAILLFVSGVANGCLYLTIFKKEKLCLYITWISVVAAGILALTSIALFAQKDHSVNVTGDIILKFTSSKLHASFWLVVVACLLVAIATIFITLAIISVHRTEERPDDRKSMISYGSVHKNQPNNLRDDQDIPEDYSYINSKVPEAFPYTDSPYSTSSESISDYDESFDSDDSDIDPKFAKLKVKVTPKQPAVKPIDDETFETRRCKSGEPLTIVRFEGSRSPKSAGSSIHRSRSASTLTPVERTENQADIDAFAGNPLYADDFGHLEQGKAPNATNLMFPVPAYDSDDAFILRRAKTEMPFTQRMKAAIGRNRNETNNTQVRAPAQIETETTSASSQHRTQSFPKKPQKSKRKRRQPSELQLRRVREMTDVYSASPSVQAIYPPHQSHKSAPWNSARSRPKTSTLLKWSLHAYGVESIPKLPKHLKSPMRSGTESVTLEDREINGKNCSNA